MKFNCEETTLEKNLVTKNLAVVTSHQNHSHHKQFFAQRHCYLSDIMHIRKKSNFKILTRRRFKKAMLKAIKAF